ncbi:MAG: thiamine-phosphate kinase [Planctomycetota bacterium]|nr:thiamine-phosphate kinase [Planctomycetota bacterium]
MVTERELTDQLAGFFGNQDPGVAIGIGDDGAVVRTSMRTVVACDPVVEGVHFTRSDRLELVGRKAVNRNLSDLAAMGAGPTYLLVSLLQPKWLTDSQRHKLLSGIRKAAAAGACTVVGGDVSVSSGGLVVTVTALGTAPRRPLRRDGLRVGDTLHVTGPLGGSGLGRHLRFTPRIAEGQWLAEQPSVSSGIDISDGLLLDLATVLQASSQGKITGLGAILDAAAIPVAKAAHSQGKITGQSGLHHALSDGEDHELLFGLRGPLAVEGPITGRTRRPVGVVTAVPGIRIRWPDGRVEACGTKGYQHDV